MRMSLYVVLCERGRAMSWLAKLALENRNPAFAILWLVSPWAGDFLCLSLSFLIYKMRMT